MPQKVLLLEPYFTGSHATWAEGLARHSRHDVTLLTLPGRFWKWRMHGAAVTLARRLKESRLRPNVILASDMLDLATFLALSRDVTGGVPVALYFHENQLAYPANPVDQSWDDSRRRRTQSAGTDMHYPFINYTSALAADRILWNSRFNRDSFLDGLPRFLKQFPDFNETDTVRLIEKRSQVLPVGLALGSLDEARPAIPYAGPALLLWNHRWEHDKGPNSFFDALDALELTGADYRVALLGESFRLTPTEFESARERLPHRIVQFGYAKDRLAYGEWLWKADLVVSCARHEFFGVSIAEAMYCDTWPILPNRLVYPNLIPSEYHSRCLYESPEDLVALLHRAISKIDMVRQQSLRPVVESFDWRHMAPQYDDMLSGLATEEPLRGI
ncbi:MAG: DUF3524 domain-containing protein [Chloroflexota bacterium]|nr:DUF3524 domain-containing protein [Chloroflexota bacterium]